MKKILLVLVLIFGYFLNTPSAIIEINAEEMYKNFIESKYRNEILNYTKDVGTKYTYSSRAKDFLTEENLKLILDNCETYPSVIMAMAIIETGWGKHAIGNNYFGIKGRGHIRKTKEWNGSEYITTTSGFQRYDSKADNIKAVSDLLIGKRYNLNSAEDYIEAANMVKKGGYATDPLYAWKVKFVIEKYELYRLDDIQNTYKNLT